MSTNKTRHVFDPMKVSGIVGVPHPSYPKPLDEPLQGRTLRRLGRAANLQNLAAGVVELEPGAWLAQRMWQTHEDMFIYVLEGEATLITDDGEEPMPAGSCAGFPASVPNARNVVNKSDGIVRFLEFVNIADRVNITFYPDVDMKAIWKGSERVFVRTNGEPY